MASIDIPIEFNSVAICKKFTKIHIRVVRRVSAKLVSLYKGDKGGAELEVVSLHSGLTMDEVMPNPYGRA